MRILFGTPGFGWLMYGIASFRPGRMWFFGYSRAIPPQVGDT